MDLNTKFLIDKLDLQTPLSSDEFEALLAGMDEETRAYAAEKAVAARKAHYGTDVFVRGLIEFSNFCKNDCLYCGIRRSNTCADRYRLTPEEILSCCREGYALGFRTCVLQGGEDPYFTDERMIPSRAGDPRHLSGLCDHAVSGRTFP